MKPRPSVSEMLATIVQLTKLVEDSTLANAPRAKDAVMQSVVILITGGTSKGSPNCVYLLVFSPAFIVNLTSLRSDSQRRASKGRCDAVCRHSYYWRNVQRISELCISPGLFSSFYRESDFIGAK